jgi:hypothetical protein
MSCAVDTYYFLLPSVAGTVLNYPSPSLIFISISTVSVLYLYYQPPLTRKNNLRFMSPHIPSFAQGAAQQQ